MLKIMYQTVFWRDGIEEIIKRWCSKCFLFWVSCPDHFFYFISFVRFDDLILLPSQFEYPGSIKKVLFFFCISHAPWFENHFSSSKCFLSKFWIALLEKMYFDVCKKFWCIYNSRGKIEHLFLNWNIAHRRV